MNVVSAISYFSQVPLYFFILPVTESFACPFSFNSLVVFLLLLSFFLCSLYFQIFENHTPALFFIMLSFMPALIALRMVFAH